MAEGSGGDRTEEATPKRQEEGRKQGQVARSSELNSTAVVLAGGAVLLYGAATLGGGLGRVGVHYLEGIDTIRLEGQGDAVALLTGVFHQLAQMLAPFLLATFVAGFAAAAGQVGIRFSSEAIAFKFEKLNPLEGVKRMVGPQGLFELAKNLAKVALLGVVGWLTVQGLLPGLLDLVAAGPTGALEAASGAARSVLTRMTGVLAVIAVADFAWQRHRTAKSMRMTRQEVRDEAKQSDGDPHMKARLRSVMLEMGRRRMMDDVKTADVVVTNPTHFSVALKYDRGEPAPRVVAKGKGHLALRIRQVAAEHGVPRVEDVPLARALYASVKVGDMIPAKLFEAVAQVLASVFRAQRQAHAQGGR